MARRQLGDTEQGKTAHYRNTTSDNSVYERKAKDKLKKSGDGIKIGATYKQQETMSDWEVMNESDAAVKWW